MVELTMKDFENVGLSRAHAATRREFLKTSGVSLGSVALASLLERDAKAAPVAKMPASRNPMAPKKPPLPAKAKHVIYLHLSGAPPQLDLYDYKPKLKELNMQPCPEELLKNARFAFIKGHPKMLGAPHEFKQWGDSRAWI